MRIRCIWKYEIIKFIWNTKMNVMRFILVYELRLIALEATSNEK